MSARIVQISVSPGGVPKTAVPRARVSVGGVEGDAHRNREHHGGPDRALCLYAMEAIEALQAEGHAIAPGALGENLTIAGLDCASVVPGPGSRLRVGSIVVLEVTRYTSPCLTIAGVFVDGKFGRVSQKQHPGWSRLYARVVVAGTVTTDDPVHLAAPTPAG